MAGVGVFITGAGHFGFGFFVGTLLMCIGCVVKSKKLSVQLYLPFLPFGCGVFAAIPYLITFSGTCSQPLWTSVFFLYPQVHCHPLSLIFLGSIHWVATLCGLIYCLIVLRYIGLAKKVSRHGWMPSSREFSFEGASNGRRSDDKKARRQAERAARRSRGDVRRRNRRKKAGEDNG